MKLLLQPMFSWCLVLCLVPVMSSVLDLEQKNYYPVPVPVPVPVPSGGGYGTPPSPPSSGGSGGGHHHTPSHKPPSNCGNPPHHKPPSHKPPSSPKPPTGGGGGYTPNPPTYNPPSSNPPSPGGYYNPPSGGTPPIDNTPPISNTPPIYSPPVSYPPPTTPIDPGYKPPYPCIFWGNHPDLIWGVLGWWGTVGGVFGVVPVISPAMSLQQALSNNRIDGIGSLYREGTASLLNSMVDKSFPFTTQQVKERFVASVVSDKTAADQAHVFKLANEGRLVKA